jgi:hypothetical protein
MESDRPIALGLWRCRFRKTEVAIRAAFAVDNSKQVAILVQQF